MKLEFSNSNPNKKKRTPTLLTKNRTKTWKETRLMKRKVLKIKRMRTTKLLMMQKKRKSQKNLRRNLIKMLKLVIKRMKRMAAKRGKTILIIQKEL